MDDSILDVTGQSFSLPVEESNRSAVPYWRHQSVFSYSELNAITYEQRRFYKTFRANFFNGIFMDLDWNTNYAFLLLYDVVNEYENHKDNIRLENQLRTLAKQYPKTKVKAIGLLIEKLRAVGDSNAITRICREEDYQEKNHNDDYWKLGTKYRANLNLTEDEVSTLNLLWNPSNNFFAIEFCGREIVRLYLLAIKRLDEKYRNESTSLEGVLNTVAEHIGTKHFNYRKDGVNYSYSIRTILEELHFNIFKHCENKVREVYGHKRKLNTELPYMAVEVTQLYTNSLLPRLEKALAIYTPVLETPDRDTELELNAQNPARWKIKYDLLTAAYDGDAKQFVSDIVILGNLNKRNMAVENIFYEASKFIAQYDNESALRLYVYYLHYDLRSVKFDNKPLAKTLQKKLFKNNGQLHDFQIIVSNLINDRDLDKALRSVPQVYKIKRKKIELDRNTIQQVHEKHSGTVELLNEYLKDEYEDESNTFKTEEINEREVVMEIVPKASNETLPSGTFAVDLNAIQRELIAVFYKSNLSVEFEEVEQFSKSRGMFRNQLIDSINESCYEILDDVLIEEEEEEYTITDNYYQKIVSP